MGDYKKKSMIRHITIGVLLIAASLFCFSMYYPHQARLAYERPDLALKILSDLKSNKCKSGVKNALIDAGLDPTIPIKCHAVKKIKFESRSAEIINVYYEPLGGDMGGDRSVPVLELPNRKFVVLPHQFFRGKDLNQYISESAKAPFAGNKSNFNLKNFADAKLINKENSYCIVYTFSFPFTGEIMQCPKPDALDDFRNKANDFYGEVKYLPNVFQWEDALKLALEEAGTSFRYAQWAKESKYYFWSSLSANSVIKITGTFSKTVESYIFSVPTRYAKGKQGVIIVQVFPDGKVRSKEVSRKSYKAKELLELTDTF